MLKNILFSLLLCLLIIACSKNIDENKETFKNRSTLDNLTHKSWGNYKTVYPMKNQIFYTNIHQCRGSNIDSVYFKLTLFSLNKKLIENLLVVDNKKIRKVKNELYFSFKNNQKEYQYLTLKLNSGENKFEIKASFDSKIADLKNNRIVSDDDFIIHHTDIPYLQIKPNQFLKFFPTSKEKAYILDFFSKQIKNIVSKEEKLAKIKLELFKFFETRRGTPSNLMDNLSVFEQFKRLQKNKDKAWCGNIANVFCFVSACYGYKSRIIGLGNTFKKEGEVTFYHSDHHTISEVYNDATEKWEIVDITGSLSKATFNGKTLNFIDFIHLINNEKLQRGVTIFEFEPKLKKVFNNPIIESQKWYKIRAFYKGTQKFCFPYSENKKTNYLKFN